MLEVRRSTLRWLAVASLAVPLTGGMLTWWPGQAMAASSAVWSAAGTMVEARAGHTATVLKGPRCDRGRIACGEVLVTGGNQPEAGVLLQDATLYDPVVRRWLVTAPMLHPRVGHTATLLHDGRVLVTGGYNASGDQSSAEIFDPADGSWTATGAMSVARYNHTATLLWSAACEGRQPASYCGKVLVAGGELKLVTDPSEVQGSPAELFDPVTGRWTPTGPMAYEHYYASATALPDGRVLVAGGRGFAEPQPWAEIYDPVKGVWSSAGMLNTPRVYQTATLLTGPACAGSHPAEYCGRVLLAGGVLDYAGSAELTSDSQGGGALSTAESWDPAANTWTLAAPMMQPRAQHAASLLPDGRVLVAGGGTWDEAAVEIFDPAGGTSSGSGWGAWSSGPGMAHGRLEATATPLWWPACDAAHAPRGCGDVLVTGGFAQPAVAITTLDSAEIYGASVSPNSAASPAETLADRGRSAVPHPGKHRGNPAF